jgi:hypothetical protein
MKKCIRLVQYIDLILIFSLGSKEKKEHKEHTFQTGVTIRLLNPNDSSIKLAWNDMPILVKINWVNVY